jgi:hypothetical protein
MQLLMIIELYRDQSSFQFEYFGIWQKVMELALLYGWVPIGTVEPQHWEREDAQATWTGRYDHYQGEWVSPQDAARMADALTSALDDLPDHPMPDRVLRLKSKSWTTKTTWPSHFISWS